MKKLLIILLSLYLQNLYAQTPPNYPPAPAAATNISAIEYFIDSKPEFGSGISLTGFTSATNVSGFNGSVNVSGLPMGFHRIYFRSKDANNMWSVTNNNFFDNYTTPIYAVAPAASTNITNIEYFIDTKPEFGSGTLLTGFTPSTNISGFNGNVNVTGLPGGFHRLYIRSKDANNTWSLTNQSFFDNYAIPVYSTAPAAVTNIVAIEYFIDNNDLGFGNCTPISFTPNTNVAGLNANINVTGLPQGVHRLFIRTKDANNKWSVTNFSVFDNSSTPTYPLAPATAPAIAQMEYYIDTDPGFGNATPITVPGNTGDVNNYSVSLPLSGSLSVGTHYLYIRSRQNPWSITNIVPFSANSITPITWQYIKGQLINNDGHISWGTAQEVNTKQFIIEHSTDGINFAALNTQPASGNSNTLRNYSYIHTNITAGLHYYRIKQVDNDGKFSYSPIVTLLNKKDLKQTLLAPNPATTYTLLVLPTPAENTVANVLTVSGQKIITEKITKGSTQHQLNLNSLPKGEYVVELISNTEKEILRLIKQ